MTFSPVEAEVLLHVTEDFCTLQEVRERLERGGVADPSETDRAIAWLEQRGLIARWRDGQVPVYLPTPLGELELAKHRSRSRYVELIGGEL